jgi:hypothetical protein
LWRGAARASARRRPSAGPQGPVAELVARFGATFEYYANVRETIGAGGGVQQDALRALLGAGGPAEWAAEVPWPLHQVLAELCGSKSAPTLLQAGLRLEPRAGVGVHVSGVESVLHDFARRGELALIDEGFFSSWQVVEEFVPGYRRLLLTLPAEEVVAIYRAGLRWAALSATSLKNLRTACASAWSTTRSGTPNRRHSERSGLRY